jgi:glycosyltransferase involved in cell wall biosynthesis
MARIIICQHAIPASPGVKVALVCPTIGQTRRGYERFIGDLFRELRTRADVTLFKGAGPAAGDEIVVPHLRRTGILEKATGGRLAYTRYRLEFASFAFAAWPRLAAGRYDLVHFIDPPLARWFAHGRRMLRSPIALVFTDAGPVPCDAWRYVDRVHCLTPAAHGAALRGGTPAERLTMIPVGVDPAQFRCDEDRTELRRRYGVPADAFVVLAVTTLNRHHKRIDHLIEEVARVPGALLWIDAGLHPDGDPTLLDLARARLGARFHHTHVASGAVAQLYRCADVLVSASLEESFGMALVEAATTGLPVIAHDSPHFRWLLGDCAELLDMASPGTLAASIARRMDGGAGVPLGGTALGSRLGWHALREDYLAMYRETLSSRLVAPGGTRQ